MHQNPECPKCGTDMREGWIAEIGRGTMPSQWVEGRPESSLWTGTKAPADKTFEIVTFGCSGCGYLESYRRKE